MIGFGKKGEILIICNILECNRVTQIFLDKYRATTVAQLHLGMQSQAAMFRRMKMIYLYNRKINSFKKSNCLLKTSKSLEIALKEKTYIDN